VAQAGDALGLALEALDELGFLHHRRMKDLDRHVAIQAGLETLVNVGHTAATQAADDLIAPQRCTGKIAHGPPRELQRLPAGGALKSQTLSETVAWGDACPPGRTPGRCERSLGVAI